MARVAFKNRLTGSLMYVDESRVEEYKAAGHPLAAKVSDTKDKESEEPKEVEKKTVKKTTKRTVKK